MNCPKCTKQVVTWYTIWDGGEASTGVCTDCAVKIVLPIKEVIVMKND